jgi:hypothetical protein
MRKTVTDASPATAAADSETGWLDLERLARIELTSEDAACPIESALVAHRGAGWRAASAGAQTIRLRFDEPQALRRIRLRFDEPEHARTQEFALSWMAVGGASREIVRQQYTFSPPGTTVEVESYDVSLSGVTALELVIVPDISGGSAHASLAEMRVG